MRWKQKKSYLRESEQQRWLTPLGALSPRLSHAIEVADFDHAVRLCHGQPWHSFEMVLRFGDNQELVMPIV